MISADLPASRPAVQARRLRVAFLCGCLAEGKDGVGDYTRALAQECEGAGVSTLAIALNDGFLPGIARGEGQVRLASRAPWRTRVEVAREAIDEFDPDILSLQWVPYSFHPRGVLWGMDAALRRIAGGRSTHVMCHELWIGAETGARVSHRVIGAMQRALLRKVIAALEPVRVHTSNPAYAGLLRRMGMAADILPMFGTVPLTGEKRPANADRIRFGMFGQLHPAWSPEPLLPALRGLGKRIELAHIGRMGPGEPVWTAMEQGYAGDFLFTRHGEQPPERISQFLMEMDFGIASTPLALIGKSGSAAAMIEHGLPVIVTRDDVQYRGIAPGRVPDGVIAMGGGLLDILRTGTRRPSKSIAPAVARQFLDSVRGVPR